jgi:formylglycine-generating enzyme required for sulfatase activity
VQWEHAARGGSDLRFLASAEAAAAWTRWNGLDDRAAPLLGEPKPGYDDGYAYLAPAGAFPPNGFGLHEVLGNVTEWCRDGYADSCADSPPRDGDGLVSPAIHLGRSHRGGSHSTAAFGLRVSRRNVLAEKQTQPDLGIRPVRRILRNSPSSAPPR